MLRFRAAGWGKSMFKMMMVALVVAAPTVAFGTPIPQAEARPVEAHDSASVPFAQARSRPASTARHRGVGPSQPARPLCAGVPRLVLADDFDRRFTAANLAQLRRNFERAYCTRTAYFNAQGVANVADFDVGPVVYLLNRPDANQLAFLIVDPRRQPDEAVDVRRHNSLENHFVSRDGAISIPSIPDIQEAMFCVVSDWSELESGRCLLD